MRTRTSRRGKLNRRDEIFCTGFSRKTICVFFEWSCRIYKCIRFPGVITLRLNELIDRIKKYKGNLRGIDAMKFSFEKVSIFNYRKLLESECVLSSEVVVRHSFRY